MKLFKKNKKKKINLQAKIDIFEYYKADKDCNSNTCKKKCKYNWNIETAIKDIIDIFSIDYKIKKKDVYEILLEKFYEERIEKEEAYLREFEKLKRG